jgi:hypothetical protein
MWPCKNQDKFTVPDIALVRAPFDLECLLALCVHGIRSVHKLGWGTRNNAASRTNVQSKFTRHASDCTRNNPPATQAIARSSYALLHHFNCIQTAVTAYYTRFRKSFAVACDWPVKVFCAAKITSQSSDDQA